MCVRLHTAAIMIWLFLVDGCGGAGRTVTCEPLLVRTTSEGPLFALAVGDAPRLVQSASQTAPDLQQLRLVSDVKNRHVLRFFREDTREGLLRACPDEDRDDYDDTVPQLLCVWGRPSW